MPPWTGPEGTRRSSCPREAGPGGLCRPGSPAGGPPSPRWVCDSRGDRALPSSLAAVLPTQVPPCRPVRACGLAVPLSRLERPMRNETERGDAEREKRGHELGLGLRRQVGAMSPMRGTSLPADRFLREALKCLSHGCYSWVVASNLAPCSLRSSEPLSPSDGGLCCLHPESRPSGREGSGIGQGCRPSSPTGITGGSVAHSGATVTEVTACGHLE